MPMMEFGVLSDMFDIKDKALKKLFKQQVEYFAFQKLFLLYLCFFIHMLSFSMFRVSIESSFYRRTRKW